ncbi:MAG: hypothetical protein HYZ71_09665 [Deltaproteobacteria bacterium]|nr:hypothetical protein [Deltaproteobacteria bacterium]
MVYRAKRGFLPVFLALGIVAVLSMMSLSLSFSQSLRGRVAIEKLNRIESFFTGELVAWHTQLRKQDGFTTNASSDLLDNDYAPNVNLPPDPYLLTPGAPLNVSSTLAHAPTPHLVRRYTASSVQETAARGNCGLVQLGRGNYHMCLAEGKKAVISDGHLTTSGPICALIGDWPHCWGGDGGLPDYYKIARPIPHGSVPFDLVDGVGVFRDRDKRVFTMFWSTDPSSNDWPTEEVNLAALGSQKVASVDYIDLVTDQKRLFLINRISGQLVAHEAPDWDGTQGHWLRC